MTIDELRRKYISFFGPEPTETGELERIENRLGIVLPLDFAEISTFYSGGMVGGMNLFDFPVGDPGHNITCATERFRRAVGLPRSFVVLAELGESFIVLNTNPKAGEPSVIWCDNEDVYRLDTLEELREPSTWTSYAQFFQYLLDEEQLDRDENAARQSYE
jgi:hypothetical protein